MGEMDDHMVFAPHLCFLLPRSTERSYNTVGILLECLLYRSNSCGQLGDSFAERAKQPVNEPDFAL